MVRGAFLGLLLGAGLRVPAYLAVRQQHWLFRTGWVRHRSDTVPAAWPWGWRDVSVDAHRELSASSHLAAETLAVAFTPERLAEVWFRERFESCCSFMETERCCSRPPSWWKETPHHSGDDE